MRPKNKKKSNNPLYVVTNNGKDVEPVGNYYEAFIKKFGLEPIVSFLESMLELLLAQVTNYAGFAFIKELFDELMNKLNEMREKITPLLSFI